MQSVRAFVVRRELEMRMSVFFKTMRALFEEKEESFSSLGLLLKTTRTPFNNQSCFPSLFSKKKEGKQQQQQHHGLSSSYQTHHRVLCECGYNTIHTSIIHRKKRERKTRKRESILVVSKRF